VRDRRRPLFPDRDYVSSLTLAGTAEEILGTLSRQKGLASAVDFVADDYRGKTETDSDKKHRKFITDILNHPKNQAKHAGDPTKTGPSPTK
jgi:hypothetical protein